MCECVSECQREREGEPVNNKNTQEEADDAKERNPSRGNAIDNFVGSAQTHFRGFTKEKPTPSSNLPRSLPK